MDRTNSASLTIAASPRTIYRALLDPRAVAAWRPPKGMRGRFEAFDPREGGTYRMILEYDAAEHAARGKTSAHVDVVEGRFLELVPDARVVELVRFVSDDPAFAGAMTVTTTLAAVPGGTEVGIVCANVPPGIAADEHRAGLASTLENLAAFTE